MNCKSSNRQNQAVAILAIATAAIGFGLFGADFELQVPSANNPFMRLGFVAQILGIFTTPVAYWLTLIATGRILAREDRVTGLELVRGPMKWLVVEMLGLSSIFLGNLLTA